MTVGTLAVPCSNGNVNVDWRSLETLEGESTLGVCSLQPSRVTSKHTTSEGYSGNSLYCSIPLSFGHLFHDIGQKLMGTKTNVDVNRLILNFFAQH